MFGPGRQWRYSHSQPYGQHPREKKRQMYLFPVVLARVRPESSLIWQRVCDFVLLQDLLDSNKAGVLNGVLGIVVLTVTASPFVIPNVCRHCQSQVSRQNDEQHTVFFAGLHGLRLDYIACFDLLTSWPEFLGWFRGLFCTDFRLLFSRDDFSRRLVVAHVQCK